MYMEYWMIFVLFVVFVGGMYHNYKAGVTHGCETILAVLEQQKIIRISEDGEITGVCND